MTTSRWCELRGKAGAIPFVQVQRARISREEIALKANERQLDLAAASRTRADEEYGRLLDAFARAATISRNFPT